MKTLEEFRNLSEEEQELEIIAVQNSIIVENQDSEMCCNYCGGTGMNGECPDCGGFGRY